MRRLLLLAGAWTVVAFAMLLFWPSAVETPGCASLVSPSAACLAQLADINDRAWWTRTVPLMVFLASGYVVLGILPLRRLRASEG